jgi:hypothetical protein
LDNKDIKDLKERGIVARTDHQRKNVTFSYNNK